MIIKKGKNMGEKIELIIICLLIIGESILISIDIVHHVASESWEFRRKEYDSVQDKTTDFYIEYEKKKKIFIKENARLHAIVLSMVRVMLF